MLRGAIAALCSVSLIVASACASQHSNGDDPHDSGDQHESAREPDDFVGVETGSQDELPSAPDGAPPAEGWRWESSLGIELAVPADWAVNDSGCGQTDAPTIVRSPGVSLDCFTPEPSTKEIVRITHASLDERNSPPEELTTRDISIGDVPAQRAEGLTADGRAAGRLSIPSLGVMVSVRVLEDETLLRVLDSVRIVQVDHNGCATARADMRATPPAAETFVPVEPTALSICFFDKGNVLESSALIDGPGAMELVERLNHAKRGLNADVPEAKCGRTADDLLPDLMLISQGGTDRALVLVSFWGCTHRGMTNGRSTAQLTEPLLHAIMAPLDRGYGYQPFRK